MKACLSVVIAALLSGLAGCGDRGSAEGSGNAASGAGPAVASPDADLVRAVTLSEGTAPAELRFRLPARPAVGTDLDVSLSLTVRQSLTGGKIRFAARSGLALTADSPASEFGATEAGQSIPYTVSVRPGSDGIGELVAMLEGETRDGPFHAEYSVPVITTPAP
jgi:hypothetical protein